MRGGRRLYLAYPALIAAAPVLSRHAENLGGARHVDAVGFALALAAGTAVAQAGAYALLRLAARRPAPALADWATLFGGAGFVAFFYQGPRLSDWASAATAERPAARVGLLALGALAGLLALWWAARRGGGARAARALGSAGRFVALAAALVTGWSAARVAASPVRDAWLVRRSALARALARPVPAPRAPAPGPPRDVYVVVLDAYPGAESLREAYGIDNAPFLDSLRALGFRTPAGLRSNYAASLLSISAFLNFAHVRALGDEAPPGYRAYGFGAALLERNRTTRFLKARGYRFAFFASGSYAPTRQNRDADVEFPRRGPFDPAHTLYRSNLLSSFAGGTMLRRVLREAPPAAAYEAGDLLHIFADVAALARRPAGGPPVYALAHLLMPHPPFVVDADCRPFARGTRVPVNERPAASPAVRAALAATLACENRLVLATVRAILARPGPRPIVILQGDHGLDGLGLFDTPLDSVTVAQVRNRYTPFGAYYLPDGGAAAIPEPGSLVNVMRGVLGFYYGADLPPLPNAMYYSHWLHPYRVTELDTLTLRPLVRPDAGRRGR